MKDKTSRFINWYYLIIVEHQTVVVHRPFQQRLVISLQRFHYRRFRYKLLLNLILQQYHYRHLLPQSYSLKIQGIHRDLDQALAPGLVPVPVARALKVKISVKRIWQDASWFKLVPSCYTFSFPCFSVYNTSRRLPRWVVRGGRFSIWLSGTSRVGPRLQHRPVGINSPGFFLEIIFII